MAKIKLLKFEFMKTIALSFALMLGVNVIMPKVLASDSSQQSDNCGAALPFHPYSPEFISLAGDLLARKILAAGTAPNLQLDVRAALISGGAAGVNQDTDYGDCWFEAGVGALARLRLGRDILSRTIIQKEPNKYEVNFFRIGKSVTLTQKEISQVGVYDGSPWAKILEAGAIKAWPNLVQQQKPANIAYRGVLGLSFLTGNQVENIDVHTTAVKKVSSLLETNLREGKPMTAGTYTLTGERERKIPEVLVPAHVYIVISYDKNKDILILKNPWGHNATAQNRVDMPGLPAVGHQSAGVLDIGEGLVQMSSLTFQQYFHYLSWTQL